MADSGSKVYVIGAGGHAKVVIATLRESGREVAGAFDDDPQKEGMSIMGVPVLGPIVKIESLGKVGVVLAVGDNRRRKLLVESFGSRVIWRKAVHPRAYVHESVQLGEGTVVFAGAVIQPESRIGAHSIVNTGATIDHDCTIGAFTHVAPGVHIAGGVKLEEGAFVGIGAAIINGLTVGEWSTIGAGAVVTEDVQANVTAVGVPARITR
jgi:sugar O-acyltransferase (sialic acid O-acetyltransferase NeuD family)